MRLVWSYGIEGRQATVVLPCLQASFEDLRALPVDLDHYLAHALRQSQGISVTSYSFLLVPTRCQTNNQLWICPTRKRSG